MTSHTTANPEPLFELLNGHAKAIVAISGGGDSVALACLLSDWLKSKTDAPEVTLVTIDHGLRAESASEANWVASFAADHNFEHRIERWNQASKKASADGAREARYNLLAMVAKDLEATAVLLGHTSDDQAETILMRSLRMTDDSGTRGLAGMNRVTTHGHLKLIRPLLNCNRVDLRRCLSNRNQDWIDDPSNDNKSYERIRAREGLTNGHPFPPIASLCRFADLNQRARYWLNEQAAPVLQSCVQRSSANSLVLSNCRDQPAAILVQCFSQLIQIVGGRIYRTPERKFNQAVDAYRRSQKTRLNVGNCIISVGAEDVRFEKENRDKTNNCENISLSMDPLANFRPQSDDNLHQAMLTVLGESPVTHSRST